MLIPVTEGLRFPLMEGVSALSYVINNIMNGKILIKELKEYRRGFCFPTPGFLASPKRHELLLIVQ